MYLGILLCTFINSEAYLNPLIFNNERIEFKIFSPPQHNLNSTQQVVNTTR